MIPAEPNDDRESSCAWRDTTWSIVLGAAPPEEEGEFREHLLEGCAACGAELAQARAVVAELDAATARRAALRGPGSGPQQALRQRLLASLAGAGAGADPPSHDSLLRATAIPGIATAAAPASQGEWCPASTPGTSYKTLITDPVSRTATQLWRMEPGAAYPSHRHAGREECFVLQGDIAFDEQVLEAGDYQVSAAGSIHPTQRSQKGCLLLIVGSLDDERLEG